MSEGPRAMPTPEALDDVLATEELARRPVRSADVEALAAALSSLADTEACRPSDMLQALADAALALCNAGSAGVSLASPGSDLRWRAVAGAWTAEEAGAWSGAAGPFAEVVRRNAMLLLTAPERPDGARRVAVPVALEMLLVPVRWLGEPVGVLWVVSHAGGGSFDAGDGRRLASLAPFAAVVQARERLAEEVRQSAAASRAARRFAENIVDTVRDPLLVLDAKLHVVVASRAFYATFQVVRGETEGRRVYELGNGQWDIPALRTLLEEILPQRTTMQDFEVEHVFDRIGRRVMLLDARRLQQKDSLPERILLAIEDVTERRDAEAARQEAEARFTDMVKNVRDHAIFMTDPDGVITTWNLTAERVFGLTEAEAVGRNFSIIFPPEEVATGAPAEELRQARELGRAEDERWHLRKDGAYFWAQGIVTPRHDAQGRLVGFSKILRDMDDRRRAELALREREAQYQALVDNPEHGFVVVEPLLDDAGRVNDLRYCMISPAFERQIGLPARDFLGRTLKQAMPGIEPHWLNAFDQVARTGVAMRIEDYSGVTGRWYEAVIYPFPGGLLAQSFIDVTARREALNQLRASEERLRLALAAAQMGTWHWEVASNLQRRDANLNRLLGLAPVETETPLDEFFQHVHPDDQAAVRAAFEAAVQQGHHLQVDFRVVRADGEVHWLSDKGDVFDAGDGDGAYLAGACVDITDRKRLEDALREADRRKDEFLAMLGHELRNPLAPLSNVLEMLRRHPPQGEALQRAYDMMDRQVGHLSRLVNDLLDVSRITLGLIELHLEPVDLAEVAQAAVEMAMPAVEARHHELTLALPRKPLPVRGDRARLTQVLFNLLNNAVKYTPPNGRIWVTLEREDGHVSAAVRDNGSGMTRDLLPRVFGLFTQGARTPDRSPGGMGLGLTLVKRLVEMHGGTVAAASDGPGRGSEFVIRMPGMALTEPPPAPLRPPAAPAAPAAGIALVVDNVADIADSYVWLFEGLISEVEVAYSGQQAIDRARLRPPRLVLCDIGMPDMDGYETCRRLRALPGMQSALIAAVSGYGSEEHLHATREAGFDRHLVKPISRAALEALVQRATRP